MHFATITTTAMAVFAGLASAGIQARQGPGRPTCNPGQFICGFELRTLGRPDSQLADAIRRKQLEPTQIRLDGPPVHQPLTASSTYSVAVTLLALRNRASATRSSQRLLRTQTPTAATVPPTPLRSRRLSFGSPPSPCGSKVKNNRTGGIPAEVLFPSNLIALITLASLSFI
ncbi:hypothetical protein BN1723_004361 [Verticillium longisporum]|uniref:Uncharacterized protein n=1 Tax=Verticillium longisporum TaxID=100787 RepID=A0A0G4MVP4_VERLO|nr:hypothetical protein BN1723_004361 [Verticillium longisporum]